MQSKKGFLIGSAIAGLLLASAASVGAAPTGATLTNSRPRPEPSRYRALAPFAPLQLALGPLPRLPPLRIWLPVLRRAGRLPWIGRFRHRRHWRHW